MTHSNAQSIALTVSLVAWEHERKRLENQSSRLERKKHQDLHQRKRVHAHFDETIEEAFRERRRRKRQMSLVTLDVSRENDEEIQEEIRSIVPVRIVEGKRRKNVEEKRKKKKKRRKTLPRSEREFLFFVVVLVRTLLLLIEMLCRHSLRLRECWRVKRNNSIAARRVVRYNNFVLLLYIFTIVILKICYYIY